MKVLHISFTDHGTGASIATNRLHRGLQEQGVLSQILVQHKFSDDPTVLKISQGISGKISRLRPKLDSLPLHIYRKRKKSAFSIQWLPNLQIRSQIKNQKASIVHLHWLCSGFVPIKIIKSIHCPLVWTLHDNWAYTGGCHYTGDCKGYINHCGRCPQLGSNYRRDLSNWLWRRKARTYSQARIHMVTPSRWLSECTKKSSIFRNQHIDTIPNGLDTRVFHPIPHKTARELLGLPNGRRLILFGALNPFIDKRKGGHLFNEAIRILSSNKGSDFCDLVVFGTSRPPPNLNKVFSIHCLGRLYDDVALALAYSAADVMVVPSVQEAFGQTASESLACGTPVVAFSATGLMDIVDNFKNGYLARPYDVADLASGIQWILEDEDRRKSLSSHARKKAETTFSIEINVNRYIKIYERAMNE